MEWVSLSPNSYVFGRYCGLKIQNEKVFQKNFQKLLIFMIQCVIINSVVDVRH